MSEQQSAEPEPTPQEGNESETKSFDAEYVAKLRKEAAQYRTEAKANADAAKRLSQIEDAQKTEAEKTADRIAKADAEVAAVPAKVAEALKVHLIALHEIDADDAELFLTANDPELLLKQVQRLTGRENDRKKKNNVVPREGTTSTTVDSDGREVARSLFGGG